MVIKDLYFTVSEAAEELGVTRQTIYRWIADNNISTEKIGGVVLIEKSSVKEYGRRKSFESFRNTMDSSLIDTIRKELRYHNRDKIEKTEPTNDEFAAFIATKSNGRQERIGIGGIEVIVSTHAKQNSMKMSMKLKNTCKVEYKLSQGKEKGDKKVK